MPTNLLSDLQSAKVVSTNYHAFKLRDTVKLSTGGRRLLQGHGEELRSKPTVR